MKKTIIFINLLVSIMIIFSFSIKANEDNNLFEYSQQFSDIDNVNEDFKAYYVYTLGGRSEEDTIYDGINDSARWYIQDNSIIRKSLDNDIELQLDTNSIGVVTFTKQKFVNFELEVDYKSGTSTYYWPVVAFRQNEAGKYFLSDGAGVFVQNGGKVTVWGTDGVGGPYESSDIKDYQNNEWHHLKIVVEGINLLIYVDDLNNPAYTKLLPSSFFRMGYVSLVSVNNESSFKNFKIKELPVHPIEQSYTQNASLNMASSNSLCNLAGEELESINELEGINVFNTNQETINWFKIDGVFWTILLGIALAGEVFLYVYKIKIKRRRCEN